MILKIEMSVGKGKFADRVFGIQIPAGLEVFNKIKKAIQEVLMKEDLGED